MLNKGEYKPKMKVKFSEKDSGESRNSGGLWRAINRRICLMQPMWEEQWRPSLKRSYGATGSRKRSRGTECGGGFATAEWHDESKILVRLMKILWLRLAERNVTFYVIVIFFFYLCVQVITLQFKKLKWRDEKR